MFFVNLSIDAAGNVSGSVKRSVDTRGTLTMIDPFSGTRELIIGESTSGIPPETRRLQAKLSNNDQIFEGMIEHRG
jgi:hypothetical protein